MESSKSNYRIWLLSVLLSISNENGFDGASGGVLQFTKNFKTLGEMLGRDDVFELEQRQGKLGMLPKKDLSLIRSIVSN